MKICSWFRAGNLPRALAMSKAWGVVEDIVLFMVEIEDWVAWTESPCMAQLQSGCYLQENKYPVRSRSI